MENISFQINSSISLTVYEILKQNNQIHQNPKVLKTYPRLFYKVTKLKCSPTLLDLAPLRPAVCSHMAGTEIDRLITLRKVHMDI